MATISVETRAAVIISPEEYKQLLLDQIRLQQIVTVHVRDWDSTKLEARFNLDLLVPEIRAAIDALPPEVRNRFVIRDLCPGQTSDYVGDEIVKEEVPEDESTTDPF
jgi:hypothetical protein